MDDDFYHFTIENSVLTDDIRHASPIALIALKAKAYLNLLAEKENGHHVNTRNIKKHRSDILKSAVLIETYPITASQSIIDCVQDFVGKIREEGDALISSLAKSIDSEDAVVRELLNQLSELFILE